MRAVLQQVTIPEWSNSGPVKWAADGKGLFVPSVAHGEASLLYVNVQGDVRVVRRNREGDYRTGAPLLMEGSLLSSALRTVGTFG